MSLHLCHPGFTADAVCCSLSLWTAPDSWEMHISGAPISVPTPVYLQLSPEVHGSHPHFPMASNGKQKPGPQTLEGKKNKNVTPLLAKKELDIRTTYYLHQELGEELIIRVTVEVLKRYLNIFNTHSQVSKTQ